MITKTDLISICRVTGAYSAGLSKRGARLLSLWRGGGVKVIVESKTKLLAFWCINVSSDEELK